MPAKKIDICKISTAKLRELTPKQLRRANNRGVRPYFDLTKEEQRKGNPRGLLSRFIFALRSSHAPTGDDSSGYGGVAFRKRWARKADRLEREIWRQQLQAGCKIKPQEVAARDAILSETFTPDQIDKIRGKRRPKIR